MIGKWMEDTEHESQTILKKYKVSVIIINAMLIEVDV